MSLNAYGAGLEDKAEVLALSRADLVEPKELAKLAKKLTKAAGPSHSSSPRRPATGWNRCSMPCSNSSARAAVEDEAADPSEALVAAVRPAA